MSAWIGAPRSVALLYQDEYYLMLGYLGDMVYLAAPGVDPFWVPVHETQGYGTQNEIRIPSYH